MFAAEIPSIVVEIPRCIRAGWTCLKGFGAVQARRTAGDVVGAGTVRAAWAAAAVWSDGLPAVLFVCEAGAVLAEGPAESASFWSEVGHRGV
jgi:hypothetical protein